MHRLADSLLKTLWFVQIYSTPTPHQNSQPGEYSYLSTNSPHSVHKSSSQVVHVNLENPSLLGEVVHQIHSAYYYYNYLFNKLNTINNGWGQSRTFCHNDWQGVSR